MLDELLVMSPEPLPPDMDEASGAFGFPPEGVAVIADGSAPGVAAPAEGSIVDDGVEGEVDVGGVAEDGGMVCAIAEVEKASAAAVSKTVFMAVLPLTTPQRPPATGRSPIERGKGPCYRAAPLHFPGLCP